MSDDPVPSRINAATEQRRRRRTASHLLFSIAAVLVFVAAIATLYWTNESNKAAPQQPSPSPSPSATVAKVQPTVLIQATSALGAVGNVLTSVGAVSDADGTMVSLPGDLVVSTSGGEPESIRRTASSLDTLRAQQAVATTLGVRVDAAWRMDRKALAGLVDSVGGVTVETARRLRIRDEEGVVVVTVPPGAHRLPGATASWYAVGTVTGESDSQAAARFTTVISRTLSALPDDELVVRESLTALGALAPSTIGTQELSAYLVEIGDALRRDSITVVELPTTPIVIAAQTLRWVDYSSATPLLRDLLPQAQWRVGVDGPARVLVMAPDTQPTWVASAREPIEAAGLIYVDGRGTPTPARSSSVIRVRSVDAFGLEVAEALALTTDSIRRAPSGAALPWATVDVTLGQDYVPGP